MKNRIPPRMDSKAISAGSLVDRFRQGRARVFIAITAFAIVIGLSFPTIANANPTCTGWMNQGDGTSWKECVNDDGSQHCYKISNRPGSVQYEVSCTPKKKETKKKEKKEKKKQKKKIKK